jgi:hypothetical protein
MVLPGRETSEAGPEAELVSAVVATGIPVATEPHHKDRKAVNSMNAADTVAPKELANVKLSNGRLSATLKPLSWNVIVASR